MKVCVDQEDFLENVVLLVWLVSQGLGANRVFQDLMAHRVNLDQKEHLGIKDLLVWLVCLVKEECQDHKEQKEAVETQDYQDQKEMQENRESGVNKV